MFAHLLTLFVHWKLKGIICSFVFNKRKVAFNCYLELWGMMICLCLHLFTSKENDFNKHTCSLFVFTGADPCHWHQQSQTPVLWEVVRGEHLWRQTAWDRSLADQRFRPRRKKQIDLYPAEQHWSIQPPKVSTRPGNGDPVHRRESGPWDDASPHPHCHGMISWF